MGANRSLEQLLFLYFHIIIIATFTNFTFFKFSLSWNLCVSVCVYVCMCVLCLLVCVCVCAWCIKEPYFFITAALTNYIFDDLYFPQSACLWILIPDYERGPKKLCKIMREYFWQAVKTMARPLTLGFQKLINNNNHK